MSLNRITYLNNADDELPVQKRLNFYAFYWIIYLVTLLFVVR